MYENETQEGWINTDSNNYGTWYYIGSDDEAVKGWNRIDGEFYYFNYPGGSMTWDNTIDGFYLENSGKMVNGTGWLQDGLTGDWYYFSDGEPATGWQKSGGNWYYIDNSGRMVTGWFEDATGWYFLYNNGSMAHDLTIGGYHVDNSGKMITGTGWVPSDGSWYYLKDDGEVATNWQYINDNWYYFYKEEGSMAHATTIEGYYLNDDGEWVTDESSTKDANENNSDNSNWQSQPAKNDIFDDFINWVTGDNHQKTQGEEVLEAQLATMQADQQDFLNEYSNDLYSAARGNASADRINELLTEEAETPINNKGGSNPSEYETAPNDSYAYQQYKQSLIKDEVLSSSEKIINGEDLWDQKAKDILTSDGSDLKDWYKMESDFEYTTEYGKGKIHYYKNVKTGNISPFDIKMKISKPKNLRKYDGDNFWILDLDENFNPIDIR